MTYLESAVTKLRAMINDLDDSDYTYTDDRLKKLYLISACSVLPNITEDVYEIDLENLTISPEPNQEISNLVLLKSACVLSRSEAKSNAGCNVRVIDGPSTIMMDGIFKATKEMADSFCEEYEKEKAKYLLRNSFGCSSTTPTTSHNNCCGNIFRN